MKAWTFSRYGGPEALSLTEIAMPEPKRGEIRVRVLACSVNLSDWEFLVGRPFYSRIAGGFFRPRRRVLGSDIVGIVDKIGPGATGFEIGQRVFGDAVMTRGGFAEFACVPADILAAVPESLSDDVAASLPQAGGIAVTGTEMVRAGTRLLINGAGGGSGTMALQLAKAAGAHVTAVDNAGKCEWLRTLPADQVIDYRQQDFTEMGQTWDVILDMVATRGPRQIAKALAPRGCYLATGGQVRVLLSLVLGGRFYRSAGQSIGMLLVPSGRALTEQVAQMAVDGALAPQIEAVLPFSAVPEALERTGLGQVKGKLVIRPDL